MTTATREIVPFLTTEMVVAAIGVPFSEWAQQCHAVSLEIVKSDLIEGPRRVARGYCHGVGGQHSWIVCGNNCYAKDAEIIDPTLWSYDDTVEGIWFGTAEDGRHHPDGEGSIWEWGRPKYKGHVPIVLEGLSKAAQSFMDLMGPLDIDAWQVLLTQAPVQGWPAAEVYAVAAEHPDLKCLIPIDRIGMLTDLNPGGLYLPEETK